MASCIWVSENHKKHAISCKIPCGLGIHQPLPQLALFNIDIGGRMSILYEINYFTGTDLDSTLVTLKCSLYAGYFMLNEFPTFMIF